MANSLFGIGTGIGYPPPAISTSFGDGHRVFFQIPRHFSNPPLMRLRPTFSDAAYPETPSILRVTARELQSGR